MEEYKEQYLKYKEKYLKYKNKYLELKSKFESTGGALSTDINQLIYKNFSPGSVKRIITEINRLKDASYSVYLLENDINKIIVTDNNKNSLSFKIPINYPFSSFNIFSIEQPVNPSKLIVNYILNLPKPTNSNVLIYCHPKKYANSGTNAHWLSTIIDETIKNLSNPKIYTVDIINNPDILADGFGDEFINYFSLIPTFDIVFMFDCAGPWSFYQGFNEYKIIDNEMIIKLIKNVLKIVKPNGKMIISKIITEGLYEIILSRISNAYPITFTSDKLGISKSILIIN
jgi:SAM-dependent methyltransferase